MEEVLHDNSNFTGNNLVETREFINSLKKEDNDNEEELRESELINIDDNPIAYSYQIVSDGMESLAEEMGEKDLFKEAESLGEILFNLIKSAYMLNILELGSKSLLNKGDVFHWNEISPLYKKIFNMYGEVLDLEEMADRIAKSDVVVLSANSILKSIISSIIKEDEFTIEVNGILTKSSINESLHPNEFAFKNLTNFLRETGVAKACIPNFNTRTYNIYTDVDNSFAEHIAEHVESVYNRNLLNEISNLKDNTLKEARLLKDVLYLSPEKDKRC